MFSIATSILAIKLMASATAKPAPIGVSNIQGVALKLTKQSLNFLETNGILSHGLNAHQEGPEMMHPFTTNVDRLRKRGAGALLQGNEVGYWTVDISIGTPAKTFKVDIDTGSRNLFVLQTGCRDHEHHNLWDPASSTTAGFVSDDFRVGFADGVIASGDVYADNVTIAGYMADPQVFGAVTSLYSLDGNPLFSDGTLGLAFPSTLQKPTRNLFATLVSQNKVFNPTFSIKLDSSGGELYIGGSNSMLYNGIITYARVIDSSGFWKVSMDNLRVGDESVFNDLPIVIDTGANLIFGDWDRVANLYSHIGGNLEDKMYEGFGYYFLPCNSFPTLSFTFGGRSFDFPSDAFRLKPVKDGSPDCFGSIVAEKESASFWTLGAPFLRHVYTVFDYSTSQVGFANLA